MSDKNSLKQIFCYIRALAERRFEISRQYSDYGFSLPLFDLPEHECISLPCFSDEDSDIVLSVRKAEYPPCPTLPAELKGWLRDGWDDPCADPKLIDSVELPCAEGEQPVVELFTDRPARRSALEDWLAERDIWADTARPAYSARKVYDRLYSLFSEMERDRDRLELMLGDGLMETLPEEGGAVRHPIVLERMVLEFNSEIPCFVIRDSDASPMLYTRLLRTLPGLEWNRLSEFTERIESEQIHPFEHERFDGLMGSLCNAISSECEFVPKGGASGAKFTVTRFPVLFTRSRASGYSAILDKIIDDIDTADEF